MADNNLPVISGDYEQVMERALALADWQGFPARRAEARRRGRWRGVGIANFVEITTGAPRERTEITVLPDGKVELVMGTMSSGEGHETSFAQLVTEWLGVPFESINYVAHAARVRAGGGSNSGRSMKLAATIIGNVETGAVEIVHFVAVDDVGRAVNPMILHGQNHGGIAQGVGQALLEDTHYDPASGQLLTASFMDYAMPRADNLPWLETELSEIPSPTNRLGVRSAGEGGTTPALAAVINAVQIRFT